MLFFLDQIPRRNGDGILLNDFSMESYYGFDVLILAHFRIGRDSKSMENSVVFLNFLFFNIPIRK